MKSTGDRRLRVQSVVYRSLIILFIVFGVIIIGGTIYGIFFRANPPDHKPNKQIDVLRQSGEGQIFTAIGRIRVSTADPQPGMVILFVSFVYYPGDKAFSEELTLRIRDFRDIVMKYIGSFSTAELQIQGEESIKAELLRRFNAILRLGQIETLYFSDFMVVG
jgi:flagellar basal body-associated protein FliL